MDDVFVKFLVLVGSCVVMVLVLAWYTCEPGDH